MMKTKVTALGDSLTKGVILTKENRYSVIDRSYMNIVCSEFDIYVDNHGRFGSTVSFGGNAVDRYSEQIASSDYTFLEYGGNDCDFDWMKIADAPQEDHSPKTELKAFKEQFISLIDRVRELGSKPVIISLPPIISDDYFSFISRMMTPQQKDNVIQWLGGDVRIIGRWHESYNRALFQIAQQAQVPIIDITTPFDIFRGDLSTLFCRDGIHPNETGHQLIADTILNMYL